MSRDASTTLTWADGDYTFRLGWKQLAQLQDECNAGPQVILMRLSGIDWRVEDISHTLRLGLIGGGMDPVKALNLVRNYVEGPPPLENLMHALAVLRCGLMGAPDEDALKKSAQTRKRSTTSRTGKSVTARSLASAQ